MSTANRADLADTDEDDHQPGERSPPTPPPGPASGGALWSGPFLRLLAIPLLFVQFRGSARGIWVAGGFLLSCGALLAMSFVFAAWPEISLRPDWYPGVPVKDYIIQSSEFLICAVALAHLSISAWQHGRRSLALGLAAFARAFLIGGSRSTSSRPYRCSGMGPARSRTSFASWPAKETGHPHSNRPAP